jgi:hypothetical protein
VTEHDDPLAAALLRQAAAVDSRVRGGGNVYADDRTALDTAVAQVDQLRDSLGLGEFLHTLDTGLGRPQLLLAFTRGPQAVVLKIYGKHRPDEAAVQGLWARAGASAVPVLDAGDDPTSWLLMPLIDGTVPEVDDVVGLTREMAGILRTAHRVDPSRIRPTRSLGEGVGGHLSVVSATARRHGYQLPQDYLPRAADLYSSGEQRLLHGDLVPRNAVRDRAGRLLVLDVCGYTGPAEFDAARWCARVGGPESATALLAAWLTEEPDLDPELAHALLGLELIMEAGVYEIVKDEAALDATLHDPRTELALESGARLAGLRRSFD